MNLKEKMLNLGQISFKYRGQIPLILFVLAIPILADTNNYIRINEIALLIIKGFGILISLIGLLIRYFTVGTTPDNTSGKNRKEQIADKLNTKGIYSIVRNPLYLANYFIWIGIGIYSTSYLFIIIQSLFFYIYYLKIILAEEEFLQKKYGNDYTLYIQKTPIIIPNIFLYKTSSIKLSIKKILHEEYSSTLSAILSFLYIDMLLKLFTFNEINVVNMRNYILILCLSIGLTLILKIYKNISK
ncbi:MAG: lipid A phosphate methyltransferase [Flavobacteriales bacterium]|nr:lipid A phosphate methyltransferase [Flavobacteriales bacterium]|tara:strand:+ start:28791 stop:29519 length:729 start_codon:yes stop_codon:yes gene_type:complete